MNQTYLHNPGIIAHEKNCPKHVAVIMDGNGRWAKKHSFSRTKGHQKGVESAWRLVQNCLKFNISHLTLFAFGQENWKRPSKEVRNLFRIFFIGLKRDVAKLHEKNVQLKIIGDRTRLAPLLQSTIAKNEALTQHNTALTLNVAINYSGRWDILQAVNRCIQSKQTQAELTEADLAPYLSFCNQPEPDLFIRTSGVQRISNFMLWDLAYSEMYFSSSLWPDFDDVEFEKALDYYASCERRFGLTSDQVAACSSIE